MIQPRSSQASPSGAVARKRCALFQNRHRSRDATVACILSILKIRVVGYAGTELPGDHVLTGYDWESPRVNKAAVAVDQPR